jgi:hypothetical protein
MQYTYSHAIPPITPLLALHFRNCASDPAAQLRSPPYPRFTRKASKITIAINGMAMAKKIQNLFAPGSPSMLSRPDEKPSGRNNIPSSVRTRTLLASWIDRFTSFRASRFRTIPDTPVKSETSIFDRFWRPLNYWWMNWKSLTQLVQSWPDGVSASIPRLLIMVSILSQYLLQRQFQTWRSLRRLRPTSCLVPQGWFVGKGGRRDG